MHTKRYIKSEKKLRQEYLPHDIVNVNKSILKLIGLFFLPLVNDLFFYLNSKFKCPVQVCM